MELKTWTRKSNAVKAAQKALQDVAGDHIIVLSLEAADIGTGDTKAFAVKVEVDNLATDAEVLQEQVGNLMQIVAAPSEQLTEVPVENVADADEADREKAVAEAKRLDQMGMYGEGDNEANAKCPHCGTHHISNGYSRHDRQDDTVHEEREWCCLGCGGEWGTPIKRRASFTKQTSLKGKKLMVVPGTDNPYREGSKSHAAFELIKANPGITYEDFKAKGGRARTCTEDVRAGRVEAAPAE